MSQQEAQLHPVIAFRAEPDLHAWADEQAAIGCRNPGSLRYGHATKSKTWHPK
jgi:hypothetical protein